MAQATLTTVPTQHGFNYTNKAGELIAQANYLAPGVYQFKEFGTLPNGQLVGCRLVSSFETAEWFALAIQSERIAFGIEK